MAFKSFYFTTSQKSLFVLSAGVINAGEVVFDF